MKISKIFFVQWKKVDKSGDWGKHLSFEEMLHLCINLMLSVYVLRLLGKDESCNENSWLNENSISKNLNTGRFIVP